MWIIKLLPPRTLSLQAKKPSGVIGRYVMPRLFIRANADLNLFVKENLQLQAQDRVLEVGFGPGSLISEMASLASVVEGIDFSPAMIARATKTNKRHISDGRVVLHQGDCRSLPFADQAFEKVCSINTVYFWNDPISYLTEMFRVTKNGGTIVIGFRDSEQMRSLNLSRDIFNTYTREDITRLLTEAGYTHAVITEREGAPFRSYCAVATKRTSADR